MDNSDKFLSPSSFESRYDVQLRPLNFFAIIAAARCVRRQNTDSPSSNSSSFFSKFLHSAKPSKLIYNKLVLSKSEQPLRSQGKWCREICPEPEKDHEINWKSVYLLAFECAKSSKLRVFNFKFLHRRLSTNDFLYKTGLSDNEKCTFCKRETETLFHLFWNCESTQLLWNNLVLWLQACQVLTKNMPLQADTAIGMRPDTSKLTS